MLPKISIVISTHGDGVHLNRIMDCIQLQRAYKRKSNSFITADSYFKMPEVIIVSHGPFTAIPSYNAPKVIQVPYIENSFGHHGREVGILKATGDYIALTNSDNLYVDGWLSRMQDVLDKHKKVGMVHWRCVNNLGCWQAMGGERIRRGLIDMSCVLVASKVAKKVGFPWRNFDADADFILSCENLCKSRKLAVIHIPDILSIHN